MCSVNLNFLSSSSTLLHVWTLFFLYSLTCMDSLMPLLSSPLLSSTLFPSPLLSSPLLSSTLFPSPLLSPPLLYSLPLSSPLLSSPLLYSLSLSSFVLLTYIIIILYFSLFLRYVSYKTLLLQNHSFVILYISLMEAILKMYCPVLCYFKDQIPPII